MHNMTDRWSNVRPLEIVLSAKLLRIEEYKQESSAWNKIGSLVCIHTGEDNRT